MQIKDKRIVVTGAARGIGKACASAFIEAGAKQVVLCDLRLDEVEALAESLGERAYAYQLDVSDEAAVLNLVDTIEETHGPIDIFFSNAGYLVLGGVELSSADWQSMMEVHLYAHLYAAKAMVWRMVERGEGYLVSTASAAGLLTQIDSGPYAVSKAAAIAFAEWLAIAYGRFGIKVSVLCPQAVRTNIIGDDLDMWDALNETDQASVDGVLEPEEIAAALIETIAKEELLCLPHPEVATYQLNKAKHPDRWISGMQRFAERLASAGNETAAQIKELLGTDATEKRSEQDAAAGTPSQRTSILDLVEQAKVRIEELSAEELEREITAQTSDSRSTKTTTVIDIRDYRERYGKGVIPQSVSVPRGMVEFWFDPDSPYYREGFEFDKRYVLYCGGGLRSALTAAALKDLGYQNIAHLRGGFQEWEEASKPIEDIREDSKWVKRKDL